MAIRLDLAFGGGADTGLRMQTTYDLAKARLTAKGRIKVKRYVAATRAARLGRHGTSEPTFYDLDSVAILFN
jgi:plasmid maintenance system antidote protein VapI